MHGCKVAVQFVSHEFDNTDRTETLWLPCVTETEFPILNQYNIKKEGNMKVLTVFLVLTDSKLVNDTSKNK